MAVYYSQLAIWSPWRSVGNVVRSMNAYDWTPSCVSWKAFQQLGFELGHDCRVSVGDVEGFVFSRRMIVKFHVTITMCYQAMRFGSDRSRPRIRNCCVAGSDRLLQDWAK